jgi:hypothetical protein
VQGGGGAGHGYRRPSDSDESAASPSESDGEGEEGAAAEAEAAAAAAAAQRRSLQLVPPARGAGTSAAAYRLVCRAEPFDWSPAVGSVGCDRDVEAVARCGHWSKVKVHAGRRRCRRRRSEGAGAESDDGLLADRRDGFGWCFEGSGDSGSAHLVDLASPPTSPTAAAAAAAFSPAAAAADGAGSDEDEDDALASGAGREGAAAAEVAAAELAAAGYASGRGGGLWHAREDDAGNVYYWNDLTHVRPQGAHVRLRGEYDANLCVAAFPPFLSARIAAFLTWPCVSICFPSMIC